MKHILFLFFVVFALSCQTKKHVTTASSLEKKEQLIIDTTKAINQHQLINVDTSKVMVLTTIEEETVYQRGDTIPEKKTIKKTVKEYGQKGITNKSSEQNSISTGKTELNKKIDKSENKDLNVKRTTLPWWLMSLLVFGCVGIFFIWPDLYLTAWEKIVKWIKHIKL